MNTVEYYTREIKRYCSNLLIESIAINQDGQYNDVLIVNNELIFRFAKVADAIKTLQQEVTILRCIQNHITLPIPNPIYENVTTSVVGEAFIGYRMIPGKPLWFEDFEAIAEPEAFKRIAEQLGGFLRELHHIPIQKMIPDELPMEDTRAGWIDLYSRIQTKLFTYMRLDARQRVTQHFEHFLDTPHLKHFEPALRHGDFGTGNILFDPEQISIVGIIDFGSTGLGDPAVDFAALYSYGEAFYRQCYSVYPEMEAALPRIHFYQGTFALQEALFGIENGDMGAFQSGMANYI